MSKKTLITIAACHAIELLGEGLGVYGSMWPLASSVREGGTPRSPLLNDLLGDFAKQTEEM